jgi:hypothetical protein
VKTSNLKYYVNVKRNQDYIDYVNVVIIRKPTFRTLDLLPFSDGWRETVTPLVLLEKKP